MNFFIINCKIKQRCLFIFQIQNLKYVEMGTGSMSHVKVCLCVCVSVALKQFLGNYGTYRLQIFSVDRHQQIFEEQRKKI